jgi:hypothetical protein
MVGNSRPSGLKSVASDSFRKCLTFDLHHPPSNTHQNKGDFLSKNKNLDTELKFSKRYLSCNGMWSYHTATPYNVILLKFVSGKSEKEDEFYHLPYV